MEPIPFVDTAPRDLCDKGLEWLGSVAIEKRHDAALEERGHEQDRLVGEAGADEQVEVRAQGVSLSSGDLWQVCDLLNVVLGQRERVGVALQERRVLQVVVQVLAAKEAPGLPPVRRASDHVQVVPIAVTNEDGRERRQGARLAAQLEQLEDRVQLEKVAVAALDGPFKLALA